MSAERVHSYLKEHGVKYETRTHPAAYTTSEVAEAEHIPGREMAKVVLLMAGDTLTMAVIPGDEMVDLEKAAAALGVEDVRLAEENEFGAVFPDCDTGAEPPFGALYDVRTIVDDSLTSPTITFDAGSHTEAITMALDDYLGITNPERSDLVAGS